MSEENIEDVTFENNDDKALKEEGDETISNEKPTEKKDKETKDLEKNLEEANEKYNEINDKYLRLYSEFDNYRKEQIKNASIYLKVHRKKLLLTCYQCLTISIVH